MKRSLAIALGTLLLALAGAPHPLAWQADAPRRHALLIGVTTYPNLQPERELAGPLNDVRLVRKTLTERLGFEPAAIRELSEGEESAGRPTRANIQREFSRLAGSTVNKGDEVFILYGGHGSQQPDNDPAGTDEVDGLDEIILPADVAGWDGTGVRNAISDDEIREWVTAIRNRGAFVVVVFDACQSSTLTRGETERPRYVPATDLVPRDVLNQARGDARTGDVSDAATLDLTGDVGGVAALYAAQTFEPTPEKRLPDAQGPVHGLFTYTLVEALERSATALTYRALAEQVIEKYRALGRIGPTPGFEGGGLDRAVSGMGRLPGAGRLRIGEPKDGRPTIEAGAVHGLTPGTVLRVFPPMGSAGAGRLIGHVRVTEVNPIASVAEPIAFADARPPAIRELVRHSRAEVARFEYGDNILRVAMHPDARFHGGSAAAIARALSQLQKTTLGQAEQVEPASADWIVSAPGETLVLAPASGWRVAPAASSESGEEQAPFRIGNVKGPFLETLTQTLRQIARVRGLLSAASDVRGSADVDVELEAIRYHGPRDLAGSPLRLIAGGRTLRAGEQVAFRVRNTGTTEADVTLFFVDSHYGISPIFPGLNAEMDGRLPRDRETVTSRFTVNADTVGWEQVVAIAVQSAPVRTDFRYLAQPSLERATAAEASRSGATSRSPLQRLLDRAMFGIGDTRGLGHAELSKYAIKALSWRTIR